MGTTWQTIELCLLVALVVDVVIVLGLALVERHHHLAHLPAGVSEASWLLLHAIAGGDTLYQPGVWHALIGQVLALSEAQVVAWENWDGAVDYRNATPAPRPIATAPSALRRSTITRAALRPRTQRGHNPSAAVVTMHSVMARRRAVYGTRRTGSAGTVKGAMPYGA